MTKPTIFIHVYGGVVQGVTYDGDTAPDVRLILIDEDIEGEDSERLGSFSDKEGTVPAHVGEINFDEPWITDWKLNP